MAQISDIVINSHVRAVVNNAKFSFCEQKEKTLRNNNHDPVTF